MLEEVTNAIAIIGGVYFGIIIIGVMIAVLIASYTNN